MKTFLIQAAIVVAMGIGVGTYAAPWQPQALNLPVPKAAPVQAKAIQRFVLVQPGGNDPGGVTVTVSGTGIIDGTYRAARIVPINSQFQQYYVSLLNPAGGWPQAKIIINRQAISGMPIGWVAGGYYQGASAGSATDGTVLTGEFTLIGADPISTGGTVSGAAPWGGTGKIIGISVSP